MSDGPTADEERAQADERRKKARRRKRRKKRREAKRRAAESGAADTSASTEGGQAVAPTAPVHDGALNLDVPLNPYAPPAYDDLPPMRAHGDDVIDSPIASWGQRLGNYFIDLIAISL
ncbi:hypothetical protein JYT28_00620, partial [Desulfobulbus sp. AH-315-M07]|nr:hypothetical protein [Desulfobulbus sp. AH-315-M07]